MTTLLIAMIAVQVALVVGFAVVVGRVFRGPPPPPPLDFEKPIERRLVEDPTAPPSAAEEKQPAASEAPRKGLEDVARDGLWYARQMEQHATDASACAAAIGYVRVIDLRDDGKRDWTDAAIGAAVRSQLGQLKAAGQWP